MRRSNAIRDIDIEALKTQIEFDQFIVARLKRHRALSGVDEQDLLRRVRIEFDPRLTQDLAGQVNKIDDQSS